MISPQGSEGYAALHGWRDGGGPTPLNAIDVGFFDMTTTTTVCRLNHLIPTSRQRNATTMSKTSLGPWRMDASGIPVVVVVIVVVFRPWRAMIVLGYLISSVDDEINPSANAPRLPFICGMRILLIVVIAQLSRRATMVAVVTTTTRRKTTTATTP